MAMSDLQMKDRMADGRIVLCGSNAYEKKYYFNPLFDSVPESVKEELHIICVLFTEEAGGVFLIVLNRMAVFPWRQRLRKRIFYMMISQQDC